MLSSISSFYLFARWNCVIFYLAGMLTIYVLCKKRDVLLQRCIYRQHYAFFYWNFRRAVKNSDQDIQP